MKPAENKSTTSLAEIAKLFLKLGIIGFGGPPVHIALMEKEVVTKRKWYTHEQFLDIIGATNLIPGPNSTEMTMHCGNDRAGWKGLVVAGLCFILPAVIITAGSHDQPRPAILNIPSASRNNKTLNSAMIGSAIFHLAPI